MGEELTFVKGDSSSIIDVTFSTRRLREKVREWRVLEVKSMSLHRYIVSMVENQNSRRETNPRSAREYRYMDGRKLIEALEQSLPRNEPRVEQVTDILMKAQNKTGGVPNAPIRYRPYWWNDQIERCRSSCNVLRRSYTRDGRGIPDAISTHVMKGNLDKEIKNLKKLIFQTKKAHWEKTCKRWTKTSGVRVQNSIWKLEEQTVPYK